MAFYSVFYLAIFLPLSALGYFACSAFFSRRASELYLVLVSLLFYCWEGVHSLPVLLISMLVNYLLGQALIRQRRKWPLVLGLAFNIGMLEYFKFAAEVVSLANSVGGFAFDVPQIRMPLAISFFSLTQIAFLVDCYQGLIRKTAPLAYALFVTFFPHLIIGPIVLHSELVPQLEEPQRRKPNFNNIVVGVFLIAVGLLKKLGLADQLAAWVNPLYAESANLTTVQAWMASLGFMLQLYFDFSGYTDMALGSAWIFNFRFPPNFNSPYQATSLIQFWSRWHMTLTHFLTTYIYTPIMRAGRRATFNKSLFAIFVAFSLSGLWHGARLTFTIFALLQGTALVLNHIWRRNKWPFPPLAGWLLTFIFVDISMVFFRAESLPEAQSLLWAMSGLRSGEGVQNGLMLPHLAIFGLCLAIVLFGKNSLDWAAKLRVFLEQPDGKDGNPSQSDRSVSGNLRSTGSRDLG